MKNKTLKKIIAIFPLLFIAACGSGVDTTAPIPIEKSVTSAAFKLGSDYPVDIDIVSSETELADTAFVTLSDRIIALDLNQNPIALSKKFQGLPTEKLSGKGFPNNLVVLNSRQAFLLTTQTNGSVTTGSLISFNPTDGNVYDTLSLDSPYTPSFPLRKINGKGESLPAQTTAFTPSFPASLEILSSTVAISFSNLYYNSNFEVDFAIQGMVRFFNFDTNGKITSSVLPPHFTECSQNLSSQNGFSATGLTKVLTNQLLVTCTGITQLDITSQTSQALTPGGVDLISLSNLNNFKSADLGKTAPSFRSWAVTPKGDKAYLGSSTEGNIFSIQFSSNSIQVLNGEQNPIQLSVGSQYLSDVSMDPFGKKIYVSSYNENRIYALDIEDSTPKVLPKTIDLSLAQPGGVSGVGPTAIRWNPALSPISSELYVLTAVPGTIGILRTDWIDWLLQ